MQNIIIEYFQYQFLTFLFLFQFQELLWCLHLVPRVDQFLLHSKKSDLRLHGTILHLWLEHKNPRYVLELLNIFEAQLTYLEMFSLFLTLHLFHEHLHLINFLSQGKWNYCNNSAFNCKWTANCQKHGWIMFCLFSFLENNQLCCSNSNYTTYLWNSSTRPRSTWGTNS